jgi:hypothetical protein
LHYDTTSFKGRESTLPYSFTLVSTARERGRYMTQHLFLPRTVCHWRAFFICDYCIMTQHHSKAENQLPLWHNIINSTVLFYVSIARERGSYMTQHHSKAENQLYRTLLREYSERERKLYASFKMCVFFYVSIARERGSYMRVLKCVCTTTLQ